jgi:two-component system, sensor histidine kinase YesM
MEIYSSPNIKLLLQPIVGNAVYHGLEHQESGTIMIEGTKVEKGCRQVASAFRLK